MPYSQCGSRVEERGKFSAAGGAPAFPAATGHLASGISKVSKLTANKGGSFGNETWEKFAPSTPCLLAEAWLHRHNIVH